LARLSFGGSYPEDVVMGRESAVTISATRGFSPPTGPPSNLDLSRGRGVGTQVVQGLRKRQRGSRLLAYSERADGFWASLGWERFDHPDGVPTSFRVEVESNIN
jgi:hypothetical protein